MIARLLLGLVLVSVSLVSAQTPASDAVPVLDERTQLVLTVQRLQAEIAAIRLEKSLADLRKPGWRVDLVGGQWQYVRVEAP